MTPGYSEATALVAIILLTLLNAFFTLAETALVTVRNARLQQMISERSSETGAAGSVQDLMRQPTRVGATVQVGITLASFGVAAVTAAVFAPHLAPWLRRIHIPHELWAATVLLTLLAAFVTIVIGEVIPRSFALRNPEHAALRIARPLRISIGLLSGLSVIALWLSNLLVRPFGLTATFAAPVITEEELRALLDAGAQSGAIEEEEREIIRNVISFGDTEARQVMTPRIDMKAADVTISMPDFVALIVTSGHSRIPVYEGTIDAIVGIVHAKDILPALAAGMQTLDLRTVVRPPLFVSESKEVGDLLNEFRRSNIQLAIVQDEYGGTAGLVTIEDLLEELVGEIADEYDHEELANEDESPDVSLIEGRMAIEDLNEQRGLDLPHEDFDTVGGLVFGLLGHEPTVGDTVRYDDLEFTVEKMDGRRIDQVRLYHHNKDHPVAIDEVESSDGD